jgi:sorbitol-specific phosphotransferase system component IIBC
MMELTDLVTILKTHQNASIEIMLPSGELVPEHFHITEVGRVQKDFIDCGGTSRRSVYATLQVWVANDYDHRLKAGKLADIINVSKNKINFMDGHLPVQVEYGEEQAASYVVSEVEVTSAGILFVLDANKTDCLAKDKCGVTGCC